jgi:hypothetical protein
MHELGPEQKKGKGEEEDDRWGHHVIERRRKGEGAFWAGKNDLRWLKRIG